MENKRDKWTSKWDFMLSCLGYAVGFGNVWRFPYLCGKNGGAAFLLPYLIMIVLTGFPTFYMELSVGQFGAQSPAQLFGRMCPLFSGLGVSMVIISAFTGLYYNMILAWGLHYFVNSLQAEVPWQSCGNSWNTPHCFDDLQAQECTDKGEVYYNGTCFANVTTEFLATVNETFNASIVSPSREYLNRRVLGLSSGIEEMGSPRWELVLSLLIAWVLVFLCLIKGIKSAGKVVYFTATFPYVILSILMIRGLTLKGAGDGLIFYLVPNLTRLAEPGVWADAAVQVFFSLNVGEGGVLSLSSYNDFHNNLYFDQIFLVLADTGSSIFAGFVIFPVLGFIAQSQKKTVAEIAASGVSLPFEAYPYAVTKIPFPPAWAALFFFMLFLLGIDGQIVTVDVVITAVIDRWPRLRSSWYKLMVVAVLCLVGFALGLVLTCPGGPYVLKLVDRFAAGWPLIVVCLLEMTMVMWIYGIDRFVADIRMMLGSPKSKHTSRCGFPVSRYHYVAWLIITPVLLLVVLLYTLFGFKRSTYGTSYTFPLWADGLGWAMALSTVIWIPLIALYKVVECKRAGLPLKTLIVPTKDWKNSMEFFGDKRPRGSKWKLRSLAHSVRSLRGRIGTFQPPKE